MTKKDLINALAAKNGLPRAKVTEVVESTFELILEALNRGGRAEFRNFGVFYTKMRKSRKARNPKTGVEVHVPAKRVVCFKPGKEMRERVG